jgi:magnesium chelatase family protein
VCEALCQGFKRCIVPWEDYREGAVIEGIEVLPVKNLRQLASFLNGREALCQEEVLLKDYTRTKSLDFADVQGQETAKRATMIAAAGMHNIMYIGAPGCGKTMLAKRIPDILPDMTFEESLELTQIYSIAGLIDKNEPLMKKRPFRSPHHSITQTALLGGGMYPKPGEVTLAGKGVLFLDELTEYKPSLLESLRLPLEEKKITINRMGSSCDYPADFMLAAAMNPCKCGYYPDRNRCCCTEAEVKRFLGKISRPMWDRFDVCVQVQDVTIENISHKNNTDVSYSGSSAYMKEKVETARKWQQERFKDTEICFNSQMNVSHIENFCVLDSEEKELLMRVYETFHLTMRGYHKILKVARTIADIDESEKICVQHLSEALSYRSYN